MQDAIYITIIAVMGVGAFWLGRKFTKPAVKTESKTTTFLIKSIRAIAELAVLEYITEGVAEIKQRTTKMLTVRWKRGLLRYTAKLKLGFDLDKLDYEVDDEQKRITITLSPPRILSCEIYNRKFYKLPLEKAENVPWKVDIIQDFTSDEVLALDEEARLSALKNVEEFYVLDLLRDKTKLAFKKMFALQYPLYSTDIVIKTQAEKLKTTATESRGQLPDARSEAASQ